ncbi:tetratricopeptide repeat protein [Paraburkholderia sp. RL18-103-BIB-C]|uniref:tetratricopeptide repeat protein n=1 Tax=Paraburkholderia sp. RL18-103-BIB-C TaxID=3031637 RepID=UPI0038B9B51B
MEGAALVRPLVFATSIAVALAGCGQSNTADNSAAQTTSQQSDAQQPQSQQPVPQAQAAQPAPQEFYLKDTVTAAPLQVTFEQMLTGTHIGGDNQIFDASAGEGAEYIVIRVKLKNVGTKPISAVDMPDINLVDAQDSIYKPDVQASMAAAEALGDDSKVVSDLNPDLSVTKVEAFEVSKKVFDAVAWRLHVGDNISYHLLAQNPPPAPASEGGVPPASQQVSTSVDQNASAASAAADQQSAQVAPAKTAMPADCADVTSCVGSSLDAAKHENVDGLRHIASVMDGFAKPDIGNRTIANDLNAKGLAAIRSGEYAGAEPLLAQAYSENPRNPEIAANYGVTLTHNGKIDDALKVLSNAIALDPRRTSTWIPYADALVADKRNDDAVSALWIGWQWSGNRDKALSFYASQASQQPPQPQTPVYAKALAWVKDGQRPSVGG